MNIGLSLKLKSSVKIELSASHIKLVDSKSSRDVTMKADKLPWIELLDGTLNLTEFLSCVAATQKSLPLHEILSFLNLLTHIGMLEGALQDLSRVYDEDEVLEENPRKTNTTLSSDAVARELSKMHFFENFSREALSCLAEKSRLAHLVPGTFIVHQDDKAEEFFALLKGQVSVYVQSDEGVSSRVCVLREGSVFGENALRQGGRRGADVFAKTEVQLLAIPSDIFSQCMQDFGDEKSRGLLNERIYLAQYLSSTPLFSNVPAEALSLFIQAGELRKMKKGEIVFRQGDAGEDFYLVVRGKVAIQKSDTPSIVLGQGDCFGEIALFKGVPRTATATCFDDSILMRLSGGDFWTILLTNLGVALTLEKVANIRYKGEILTLT